MGRNCCYGKYQQKQRRRCQVRGVTAGARLGELVAVVLPSIELENIDRLRTARILNEHIYLGSIDMKYLRSGRKKRRIFFDSKTEGSSHPAQARNMALATCMKATFADLKNRCSTMRANLARTLYERINVMNAVRRNYLLNAHTSLIRKFCLYNSTRGWFQKSRTPVYRRIQANATQKVWHAKVRQERNKTRRIRPGRKVYMKVGL